MGKQRSYESDDITVYFDGSRCIHAARCVHGLPTVFNAEARPWIQPTQSSADEIAKVVGQCPSGALTYERRDGGPAEAVQEEVTITAAKDGPLYLRGTISVVDQDGRPVEARGRMALCRCGASKNKPFCDNSHIESGFTSA
ncbi:MAG: (4Fe-4S)-binding protein [Gemmatimonadota bacterium]|nr:(4Fe-4S)-binding protein [Gemmatimonadota bacterium]MDH3424520.1 (4Fe-4S)-binding protein [Gemmatimonadota bacterium]